MGEIQEEETYKVHIPIYVTEPKINDDTIKFPNTVNSQINLLNGLIEKLDEHNNSGAILRKGKKDKTTTQHVQKVNYEMVKFGEDDAIMLQITSYKSNLYDRFIENETKTKLKPEDKFGSENFRAVLYPHIFGLSNEISQWVILLYTDPNKENSEVTSSIKMVLRKVLNITPIHIKPEEIITRLTNVKTLPKLSIKFYSFKLEDNEIDYSLDEYVVENFVTTIRESKYESVPLELAKVVLEDKTLLGKFKKRVLRIETGKQEIKLEQNIIDEATSKISETAEEIFNFSTIVTKSQIESNEINDTEFIVSKLQPILENYLNSYNANN